GDSPRKLAVFSLARALLIHTRAGSVAAATQIAPPLRFHRSAAASAHYSCPPLLLSCLRSRRPRLSTGRIGALSLDLDHRRGWPAELRVLLDRHPRATWAAHREASAEFWLEVHSHFRRESIDLTLAADDFRDGRRTAQEIALTSSPRLRALIAN